MEATSDGLWGWNAATDEVYYSPARYHMIGYQVGDFPGTLKGWQALLHPDDVEHTMQVNMDCVEGRRDQLAKFTMPLQVRTISEANLRR